MSKYDVFHSGKISWIKMTKTKKYMAELVGEFGTVVVLKITYIIQVIFATIPQPLT